MLCTVQYGLPKDRRADESRYMLETDRLQMSQDTYLCFCDFPQTSCQRSRESDVTVCSHYMDLMSWMCMLLPKITKEQY